MAKKKSTSNRRTPVNKKSRPTNTRPKFRVWKMDGELRAAIATKRGSRHQTIRDFVADSIREELPALVTDLANRGITVLDGCRITPVRVQMEESTLDALRDASQASGLDQCRLVIACLRLACRRNRRRGPVTER